MTWKWRSFHCLRKILSSAVTRDDDVGAGSGKKRNKMFMEKVSVGINLARRRKL